MRLHHRLISVVLGIMVSFFVVGCGDETEKTNPNAPAADVVPEEDFEGEAAQDLPQ
jgi:hypothetical protein